MSSCVLSGLPLLVGVLLASLSGVTPAAVTASTCRCVPDQWEGLLLTTDHDFDLRGGRTATMDTNMIVHYDFRNKKFAMVDVKSGNKAIADYVNVSMFRFIYFRLKQGQFSLRFLIKLR